MNIRANFFWQLLNEDLVRNIRVREDRIRWIEILPYAQGKNSVSLVKMDWSEISRSYRNPRWERDIKL